MKRTIILLSSLFIICGCNNYSEQYKQAQKELTEARDSIKTLLAKVEELSYPANQRLSTIQSLIKEGNYDSATAELNQMVSLFPNSTEAKMASSLRQQIEKGIEAKVAEEKRLKALGFKALKDVSSVTCNGVKAVLSNISIGNTFTFDSYGYEYHYRQADKDKKYITAAMSITSDDSNPLLPQCAIYSIDGESLLFEAKLDTEFARWDDYGSYLGNYADYNNDFSKVNTVKFKIGAQVSNEVVKKPFVLVMKKENVLKRTYDKYSNPEISYTGAATFEYTLSIDAFKDDGGYVAIKRFNFEKL